MKFKEEFIDSFLSLGHTLIYVYHSSDEESTGRLYLVEGNLRLPGMSSGVSNIMLTGRDISGLVNTTFNNITPTTITTYLISDIQTKISTLPVREICFSPDFSFIYYIK